MIAPRRRICVGLALVATIPGCTGVSPSAASLGHAPPAALAGTPVGASSPSPPAAAGNLLLSSCARECAIALHPTDPDHALVAAMDCALGQDIGWYLSRDGLGGVAARGRLPGATAHVDPVLAFHRDGTPFLVSLDITSGGNAILLRGSPDGGRTWAPPRALWSAPLPHVADKPWIIADHRAAGTGAGSLYVVWTGLNGAPTGVHLMVSRDAGATWSSPLQLSPGPLDVFPMLALAPDGGLYVFWLEWVSFTLTRFHLRVSTDGGRTFGPDQVWASGPRVRDLNGGIFRMTDLLTAAVDASSGPYRGRVHTARMVLQGSDVDVVAQWSDDRGQTWSAPRRIADTSQRDQLLPAIAVDEGGTVYAAWLDRRDDPQNWSYRCYAASSTDGGATWSASEQLTVPGVPTADGWVGHYNALAATRGRVFAVWAETYQGGTNLVANVRQVDLRASADTLSASAGGRVDFDLRAGPAHGSQVYVLLLGMSGTSPGTPLGCGVTLNLNWDALAAATLTAAGSAVLPHTLGVLGVGGRATPAPALAAPAGALRGLVGVDLHAAYAVLGASCLASYGSRPTVVRIVP